MKRVKEVKINKTEYFCDICEKRRVSVCNDCGRDVCKAHLIEVPPNTGDYSDFYCTDCYKIREPFEKSIMQLDAESNKLYNKMSVALENFRISLEKK